MKLTNRQVVAGLKAKHASALQKQLTPQKWEQARRDKRLHFSHRLQKNGLDLSSITPHVAMTATPPKDSYIATLTQLTVKRMSRVFTFKPQVCEIIWHTEFICELVMVDCCPFEDGDVGQSVHWHRVLNESDVSIMVPGSPDFGERTTRSEVRSVEVSNRQQTNFFGNHEKAQVGPRRR